MTHYSVAQSSVETLRREFIDKYAEARLLLRVDLANTTPALVGSWTGHAYSDLERLLLELPRGTDIAGKTRWWLRSILAGGVYELFDVHAPIFLLDKIASLLMGNTSEASRIIFHIEPIGFTGTCQWRRISPCINCSHPPDHYPVELGPGFLDDRQLQEWVNKNRAAYCKNSSYKQQRAARTFGRKEPLENAGTIPLPPGYYRFRLEVWERPHAKELDPVEEQLLGRALSLALLATGIGRGVTRGYGKVAPIGGRSSIEGRLREIFWETWRSLKSRSSSEKYKLVRSSTLCAKQYVKDSLGRLSCKRAASIVKGIRENAALYPCTHTFHNSWLTICDLTDIVGNLTDYTDYLVGLVGKAFSRCSKEHEGQALNKELLRSYLNNSYLTGNLKKLSMFIPSIHISYNMRITNINRYIKKIKLKHKYTHFVSALHVVPVLSIKGHNTSWETTTLSTSIEGVYAFWFDFGAAICNWISRPVLR